MATFELYEDTAGEFRWRLTSGGDIVADSSEGYSSKRNARAALDRVKGQAADADVLDTGRPHFELFEDRAGEFRWRMVARNGRIVADSGEGYSSKSGARHALERVQENAGDARVEE